MHCHSSNSFCKTAILIGLAALYSGFAVHADFMPGDRVLMDAHNCYPYQGRWSDRIERALATGAPLAIEQDLVWYADPDTAESRSIVSHGKPYTGEEPSLETYFFEAVRPLVETALASGRTNDWPLVTLNLDIKDNVIEHTSAIWETLSAYESWITTTVKMDQIATAQPLDVKPLLILSKGNGSEFEAFYENVPVGGRLLVFGVARTEGNGDDAPKTILPYPADNFRRWWNTAWSVVETGGQRRASDWTAPDRARLEALVTRAHQLEYWTRFYTLNGHEGRSDLGWNVGYNFGSPEAVESRWRAAIESGVDFIATDQYEALAKVLNASTQRK